MYKLVSPIQAHLLTNYLKNQRFFIPNSHSHNSTKTIFPDSKLGFVLNEVEDIQLSNSTIQRVELVTNTENFSDRSKKEESTVQISHPWPEWVEMMERLLKRGYFEDDPIQNGEMGEKDSNRIRTACLNFGRDRFDLIRYLSRKDIKVVVGFGCPSLDRKVVNSGKRLRAHVGIDEGNVCSMCSLRGDCDRAYVKALDYEGGRTVDVMRILLTYGIDQITASVVNKSCQNKTAKESVRRLLKEVVELSVKEVDSTIPKATPLKRKPFVPEHINLQEKHRMNIPMKQGDWICPKCNFLNFARNIRCLRCDGLFKERLQKLREDQDHLPLKKGDWICDKCNFLNFAKNTRCLQCKENPPKRQLNPGEWECDSCNYINFRRNTLCLKCDYRRPKSSNYPDSTQHQMHQAQELVNDPDKAQRQSANMWRFVEEEEENYDNHDVNNESSRFVDFPIKGGNTDLSRNKQKQEKWKAEMLNSNSESNPTMENDNLLNSVEFDKMTKFMESSEDEELDEWFGCGKKAGK